MTTRLAPVFPFLLLALCLGATGGPVAAADTSFAFVYLYRDDDDAYRSHRVYTGLVLRDRQRPLDGARTGLRDSRVKGRRLGLQFNLTERALAPDESAVEVIRTLQATDEAQVFIADLPLAEVITLGQSLKDDPIIVLNARPPQLELYTATSRVGVFRSGTSPQVPPESVIEKRR